MVETIEVDNAPGIELDKAFNTIVEKLQNLTVRNINETFESIENIRHSLNNEEELEILKRLMAIGEL